MPLRLSRIRQLPRPLWLMVMLIVVGLVVLVSQWSAVFVATITVINTNDSGAGSLREAISNSNATDGVADTIDFDVPTGTDPGCVVGTGVCTITLATTLPPVTDPVIIDGTTQPSFAGTPVIVIDGSNVPFASLTSDGLRIFAGNSTVKGLVIVDFIGDGIELLSAGGNTIEGNYLGIAADGVTGDSNDTSGLRINNVPNNTIGGATAATRNIISGNAVSTISGTGIVIEGSNATGNMVIGNFIGTNADGSAAVQNAASGVFVDNGAAGNTIGGSSPGEGNLISGNRPYGINIQNAGAAGNTIIGNIIGLDVTGASAVGNVGIGVRLINAPNTIIGGADASHRNVISANSSGNGILVQSGSSGGLIQGNYIGPDISGTVDLGNLADGIEIQSSMTGFRIEDNVISGNGSRGIEIGTTTGTIIRGNMIGTDVTGAISIGNGFSGIRPRTVD